MFCSKIPNRSLLLVSGNDSSKFLQGLITNHMPRIDRGGDGFFTAFLNPKGRLLYDAFVYPKNVSNQFPHPAFVIEFDTRVKQDIVLHLKRFMLRSKVDVKDISNQFNLFQLWGKNTNLIWGNVFNNERSLHVPLGTMLAKDRFCDIGALDPRHPDMGVRVVLPTDDSTALKNLPVPCTEVDSIEYNINRVLHGIPEGIDDLFVGTSLPLESNFDYMHGVDFRKGCYLGQELTIRTFHTGVTRKRIVPVQIYAPDQEVPSSDLNSTELFVDRTFAHRLPESQTELRTASEVHSKRSSARFGGGVFNIGLVLVRLDVLEAPGDGKILSDGNGFRYRPVLPKWFPDIS